MSGERRAITASAAPVTVDSLVRDLGELGVESGMTLLVHSSLSALGWVCGGPVAVVLALEELLGAQGTLVMPAHSTNLTEPSLWQNPPVPESWWETIRRSMPAYNPDLTPTVQMGAVVECFRKQPGTMRSAHPHHSFVARGRHAERVTAGHALAWSLGEESPLARVYDLDGWVLLLGVPHANNTSLHLAEHRAPLPRNRELTQGAPVLRDGRREWVTFPALDLHASVFDRLGADFARDTGLERAGAVGAGTARLMPQRQLVDYATSWLEQGRPRR